MMRHRDLRGLFGNQALTISFALAVGINLLNGLSIFYPMLPQIPIRGYNLRRLLTEKPWSAVNWFPIRFYPFVIGLGFLIPLDLSFSCWSFYLIYKLQLIVGSAMGLRSLPRFPYGNEQAAGAYIGLCALALWGSRRHLWAVFRKVLGLSSPLDDTHEPIRYRTVTLIIRRCYRFATVLLHQGRADTLGCGYFSRLVFFNFDCHYTYACRTWNTCA